MWNYEKLAKKRVHCEISNRLLSFLASIRYNHRAY